MLNPRQRSRWLSDVISDLQRYASKNENRPETTMVKQALDRLHAAKQKVRELADKEGETPCP